MPKRKGQIISREIANQEIGAFLDFKQSLIKSVSSGPTIDPLTIDAKKYFTDEASSFIFDKSLVEALLTLGSTKGANALRVYLGASPDTGLQTVVLIAAQISIDPETKDIISVENILYSDEIAGLEYPGVCSAVNSGESFDICKDSSELIRYNIY